MYVTVVTIVVIKADLIILQSCVIVFYGNGGESSVESGIISGSGAGCHVSDVCGTLEALAGLCHITKGIGAVSGRVVMVYDLCEFFIDFLVLGSKLKGLGVCLCSLHEKVSLCGRLGNYCKFKQAGGIEINVKVGIGKLVVSLAIEVYNFLTGGFLLGHEIPGGPVYAGSHGR